MKTKAELAHQLETIQGWKSLGLNGFFQSFAAKKYLKKYKEADWKGVAQAIPLRQETHEDSYYSVVAFSTKGELTEEMIGILTARVNQFPLGMVRYESTGDGGFYPMVSDGGEYYQDDYAIHRCAEDMDGVYVTLFSVFNPEKLNCPYVIYAHQGGMLYKYHVRDIYL